MQRYFFNAERGITSTYYEIDPASLFNDLAPSVHGMQSKEKTRPSNGPWVPTMLSPARATGIGSQRFFILRTFALFRQLLDPPSEPSCSIPDTCASISKFNYWEA
mmetsp:Transcript_32685/g.72081  ORF Transcript_32685/g.72081 Transcript_32685/m.72081 type:complete len:105 (+) Transcript_32685:2-316(+)